MVGRQQIASCPSENVNMNQSLSISIINFQKVLREWVYMEAVFSACLGTSGMPQTREWTAYSTSRSQTSQCFSWCKSECETWGFWISESSVTWYEHGQNVCWNTILYVSSKDGILQNCHCPEFSSHIHYGFNLLFRSRWTKLVIMINLMCGRLVACCMKHVLLFHPSLQPIRSLLQQRLRRDDSVQYHHTIPSHLAIWFLSCLE